MQLCDVASVPTSDFAGWGGAWVEAIANGHFGEVRSMVICVETKDGRMHKVSQSIGANDSARLIGLLMILIDSIGRNTND